MIRFIIPKRIPLVRWVSNKSRPVNADDPAAIPQGEEFVPTIKVPPPVRPANEPLSVKRSRLLYMSRKRGILETDLLLSTFAQKHLQSMDEKALKEFDAFLEENDWDIYYWATGAKPLPEDLKNLSFMPELLEHCKNKNKTILRMPDLS